MQATNQYKQQLNLKKLMASMAELLTRVFRVLIQVRPYLIYSASQKSHTTQVFHHDISSHFLHVRS